MIGRAPLALGPLALVFFAGCSSPAEASQQKANPTQPASAALQGNDAAKLNTPPAPFATPPMLTSMPDIAAIAARVKPAVVSIFVEQSVRPTSDRVFSFPFGGDESGGEGEMKRRGQGSGFIVDAAGHVVTNAHVVSGADRVMVRLSDEREFKAKVKGRDEKLDLAVLELEGAKDLPVASLGSSDELRVGEYVVAVGNPFGLGHTVTMGIVSAKSRTIGAGPYDDFIQTDASINPGNSGGPLFNLRGQVVGINAAINPQGQGIGFAIPADALRDVLPQLLEKGSVSRGKLGAVIQPVDRAFATTAGLDRPKGARVHELEPGGAAARAGIHADDVVLKVDTQDVDHAQDLPRLIARHTPGSKVHLEVWRGGNARGLDVTLDELRDASPRTSRR